VTKFVKYTRIPGMPFQIQPGEITLKYMGNAEVVRRAKADPDAPLIDAKQFHEFKRVNPLVAKR